MRGRFDADGVLSVVEPAFRVPLDLSPDGTALIVTIQERDPQARHGDDGYGPGGVPGEMAGSRVAVVDTDGGGLRWPFGESMVSWAGRWSPDGRRLAAYVRDQGAACLGIWDRDSGQVIVHREVLVRPFFGFEVPRWTPDSASVVVKVRREDDGLDDSGHPGTRPLFLRFFFDPATPEQGSGMAGWAGGYQAELAVVDVASGAARRLTMALLVQTQVFSAAVASAGFYDMVSAALSMRSDGTSQWLGWAESGQGRMGGSLWEKRPSYIENSPVFYLDRVTTPVLLTLGTADITPPAQAEAVYVALRRLGKKVELAEYEGEDHWPGMWTEPAYRDYVNRVIGWFDQHLKTPADKR